MILHLIGKRVENVKKTKIIAIGDSITYGFPYTPAQSWFNLAMQELSCDYVNSGVNGDTTESMWRRFVDDVLDQQPSHVIIMGGTNDAYAAAEVGDVLHNIQSMVKMAVENDIIPIVGIPIPCNEWYAETVLGEYREILWQFVQEQAVTVIDFYSILIDEEETQIKAGLHCDGLHPSEAGYRVMCEAALSVLRQII